jgi:hypothetical protein
MYETIKKSIDLLLTRMKGTEPLPLDDAKWLANAVETIIEDVSND